MINEIIDISNNDSCKIRDKIVALQEKMKDMDQIECELKHTFAPGVYAREILLPKGSLVIGKIHKHAHLNIISKGSCEVVTEFGKDVLTAPITFVSEPGTKRAVLALEDTIWTTIHPTNETDIDKIEEEIIAKDYNELSLFFDKNNLKIEGVTP